LEPHLTDDQFDEALKRKVPGTASIEDCSISEDLSRHLADCEICRSKLIAEGAVMEQLRLLKLEQPAERQPDCPPESIWTEIAAGYSDHDLELCLEHAANCDHCGPLLRNAAETTALESTSQEEAFLEELTSIRPEWQHKMAATLHQSRAEESAIKPLEWIRELFSPMRLVVGSCVAVLLVVGAWVSWRNLRPQTVDQLLAEAYTEQRTLEVRIPGAKYAPLRLERGPGKSNLDKPPALLKAESLIAENFQSSLTDANSIDERGRAEMLDGNYEAAIQTFKDGLVSAPDSFPLMEDLGAAYYMRGLARGTETDYGNAIEAFGKALVKEPHDPVALFNQALACEKLSEDQCALDSWSEYLKVDPSSDWSNEARAHLSQIRQKRETHNSSTLRPLLGPNAFTEAITASTAGSQSQLSARVERYLDAAFKSWLPDALKKGLSSPSSTDSLQAAQSLGKLLSESRNDSWLADLLQEPSTPSLQDGIRDVLLSDVEVSNGKYGVAIDLARSADKHFEIAHSLPGVLWSNLAEMEAQSSALNFTACLEDEKAMFPQLAESEYHWLQAATLIERAECQAGLAHTQDAISSNKKGRELAERFHYPALNLRGVAFGSKYLLSIGYEEEGLHELRAGLAEFWTSDVPDAPGENLYACLFNPSESIDWPFVDKYALEELLKTFPPKDPADLAAERELLGDAELRAGNLQAARAAFKSVVDLLGSVSNEPAVALRRAQIAVKDAQILLRQGDPEAAVKSLAPFRPEFEGASPGRFQASYFKALGEAYLRKGDESTAQPILERTLAVVETGLGNLDREAERLAWSRTRSEVYRDLLEIKLTQEPPAEAFAWWEWYKGASLRPGTDRDPNPSIEFDRMAESQIRPLFPEVDEGTVFLSYVPLRDSIAIFVVRGGAVHVNSIPFDTDLQGDVRNFLGLCADSTSNIDVLSHEGRSLYQKLVQPVEQSLAGAKSIRIETDGPIDSVLFDLLVTSDGHYLRDRFALTFSQGLLYDSKAAITRNADRISPARAALIVASPGGSGSYLPALPEVESEGAEVASHFTKAVLLSGHSVERREVLDNLKTSEVFHFAGHAVASGSRSGLVLGNGEVLSARDFAGVRPLRLNLAVLSACDSANGNQGSIADIDSVARTLLAAGVPHVIASRWPVDSAVTRQWMGVFYSALLAGKSPADSLRVASTAIRNDPVLHHPYYWASFAAFGSS